VDEWKKKDPIVKYKKYMMENNLASEEELDDIDRKSMDAVEASVKFAMESPEPTLESAFEDIFAD
jgi:pyruvate dehydrogenase E1 component alpha subunit